MKNIAKSEQSSHTPTVAIRDNTTLIGKREKSTNKGTDKQYVVEFSIHSTTCVRSDVCTKFQNSRSSTVDFERGWTLSK